MGEDMRERYLSARQRYERTRNFWLQHVRTISGVAEGLRRPDSFFMFTRDDQKIDRRWNLTEWPSAEDLQASMVAMKQARDAVYEEWSSMSYMQQAGLRKPPSRLGDP